MIFDSLENALAEHGDRLRPFLEARVVDPAADKFAALHAAWWSGGTVLYVPRGVTIDRPLHMLSALTPGATDLGHALVVLEEGSEATLLAETASTEHDAPGLHLGAIELVVQAGAGSATSTCKTGRPVSGILPISAAWSSAMPDCNGPSRHSAADWPRSTSTSP